MTKPRCVVDTNVLISGALSKHGKPRKVVDFIDAMVGRALGLRPPLNLK